MSEARPESAPLSPEERAEQIRLAKERAAAARAAREGGLPPPAQAPAQMAQADLAETGTAAPEAAPPPVAAASPAAAERAAPASPADRAAAIQAAKERAAAARAAREGGAPLATAPAPAPAPAAQATAPAAAAAPAARAERAAPATPEERAAAIQAAKERAAAARAAGGSAVAQPAAAAAPKPALSPEQRAAALAQAQERAAALKAQRTITASKTAPVAAPPPPATWRVVANGKAQPIATARPEPRAQAVAETSKLSRLVMRRRQFLRGGFWGGAAVLAVGSLATFLDFFNPRDITGFGGVVTVPASDVPPEGGDPVHYLEAKVWVSNLKKGEGVVNGIGEPGPAGVLVLYQKCPHLGCTVPWRSDFNFLNHTGWFRCPCHGSTYTKAGYRVFGPAPHSMWTFPVKVNSGGSLSVNTGKISNGNLIQATTTVPYHT